MSAEPIPSSWVRTRKPPSPRITGRLATGENEVAETPGVVPRVSPSEAAARPSTCRAVSSVCEEKPGAAAISDGASTGTGSGTGAGPGAVLGTVLDAAAGRRALRVRFGAALGAVTVISGSSACARAGSGAATARQAQPANPRYRLPEYRFITQSMQVALICI